MQLPGLSAAPWMAAPVSVDGDEPGTGSGSIETVQPAETGASSG